MLGGVPRVSFHCKSVAVGGTFDVFHRGHEQLIWKAFELGEKVLIGVTSDSFVTKLEKTHSVQPYVSRVTRLRRFLRERGWLSRATIVPLEDTYGPASRRRDLEALVITPDTSGNATKLNRIRKENGLHVLKIHRVKLSEADDGKPISSTRIRKGEIDREGRVPRSK